MPMRRPDMSAIVMAEEIFGRPGPPVPWPETQPVLEVAVEMLPMIEDGLTADLVKLLTEALVDLMEELRAVRTTLSSSLELSHAQHHEIARLQKRLTDLLDERRRALRVAA